MRRNRIGLTPISLLKLAALRDAGEILLGCCLRYGIVSRTGIVSPRHAMASTNAVGGADGFAWCLDLGQRRRDDSARPPCRDGRRHQLIADDAIARREIGSPSSLGIDEKRIFKSYTTSRLDVLADYRWRALAMIANVAVFRLYASSRPWRLFLGIITIWRCAEASWPVMILTGPVPMTSFAIENAAEHCANERLLFATITDANRQRRRHYDNWGAFKIACRRGIFDAG